MKKIITFLLFFFCIASTFSQSVGLGWAKSLDRRTGLSGEETYLVGVDSLKNVYTAGNFRNTMDIDPGPGVFNVTSQWDGAYITKLDPYGNFIWGKQISGDRFTLIKALFVDAGGNVYSTGRFSGTTDFDPGIGTFLLSEPYPSFPEANGAFLLRLDKDGNFKWVKKMGGEGAQCLCSVVDLTGDKFGNVYTTGYFNGTTDLNPNSGVDNQGSGYSNIYIVKLDSLGSYKFGRVFNGTNDSHGQYIRTDKNGNIYTSGYFGGTVDFDPGAGISNITAPLNSGTPFISKLDSSGIFIWAKKDIGNCPFTVDPMQNIISFTGNTTGLLEKYDTNGNVLWSKVTGGAPYFSYQTFPIVSDDAGNIFITGKFRYTQDFDPNAGVFNMSVSGGGFDSDIFVCRINANGDFGWAVKFGNYAEDYGLSIALDNSGNIYTTGVYISTVDFDPGPGVYNLSSSINQGIFIHKLAHCLNSTSSTLTINACNAYSLNNIIYNSSGTYIQTISNSAGCDSIITLHLVLGGSNNTYSVTACENYLWNNHVYTSSGIYKDTILTAGGCDSINTLNLTINSKTLSTVNSAICEGQSYLGHSMAGVYVDTLISVSGCDSIRTLNLSIKQKKYSYINSTICQGQSFQGYTSTGIYMDTLISSSGCDSFRTLDLKVNTKYQKSIVRDICEGESYLGHTSSGNYTDTLKTQFGCDSIINSKIKVTELPRLNLGTSTTICSGDSIVLTPGNYHTYLWQDGTINNNFIVKKAGIYSVSVTNNCGTGSAKIKIMEYVCKTYFPNAFTPNNDGNNDIFKIINPLNISKYALAIYNRYGEKVFETNDYLKGWDGKYKSQLQQSGVYIWKCSFLENRIVKNTAGTIMLLR